MRGGGQHRARDDEQFHALSVGALCARFKDGRRSGAQPDVVERLTLHVDQLAVCRWVSKASGRAKRKLSSSSDSGRTDSQV